MRGPDVGEHAEDETILHKVIKGVNHWWEVTILVRPLTMQFTAWEVISMDHPAKGPMFYRGADGSSFTEDRQAAMVILDGWIKSDGCMDFTIGSGDDYQLHCCSRQGVRDIGTLLEGVYEIAANELAHWTGDD